MDINIGELSVGSILSRGMSLLFKRLPYFFAIQLLVGIPTLFVQLVTPFQPLLSAAALLPLIVLGPIASAAMLRVIVQEYLDGEVRLGEAFQFAGRRFLPLFGTSLLFGFLVWLGLLLCCVPGIYLAIVWCMMSQIVVVENLSGMEALNRSKSLTEGFLGHVFAVLFLLGLFSLLLTFGVQIPLALALPFQQQPGPGDNPFAGGQVTNYANFMIVTAVAELVSIFTQAYSAVCVTLLYFDLRSRKEGYDLPIEFAKIARWREQAWDDDDDDRLPPQAGGTPATGIKERGTTLPPPAPPETGIQEPPSP